ncbi:hypothetical protein D3C77_334940 [compost metagenome]
MISGRSLLLCVSLLFTLQGCFDEPEHVDQNTDRSKSSLQMQQPDTPKEKAE